MHYNYLIVGAGLSGATIAEHLSREGKNILVIEKRDHIAGNCYDTTDKQTGIRISKYGAHLFHTNDEEVWNYVQRFGKWQRWDHKVIADVSGAYIPVPVNPTTVNTLYNAGISSETEMKQWLEKECPVLQTPENSEEVAISRVGPRLYDLLFKEYTVKQWDKSAKELDPSVLSRIPIRTTFDDRYFSDRFQALPINGYTSIVQEMLNHPTITVRCNTSWEDILKEKESETISWDSVIFTGPIDHYFEHSGLPKLEYRSIIFEWSILKESGYYQPNSVVNYPSKDIPYTRCIEYKHFLHQKSDWTILSKETTCSEGEPYYPVPTEKNKFLYTQYSELASKEKNVYFVGRLASYKYFNMDQAIRNAIDYYTIYLK